MRPFLISLLMLFTFLPGIGNAIEGPELLWNYQTTDSILSVHTDGKYVIANSLNRVYLLDARGNLLWKTLKSDGDIEVSAFSSEYKFAVAAGRFLYLYNETGNQTNKTRFMNIKAIDISQDGSKIVLGSFSPAIICLNNKGTPIWEFIADNGVISVAISKDGGYVVGNSRASVYLLGSDGTPIWRYRSNESINAVSMDGDGRYVVAAGKEHLYFFNAEGKVLWAMDIAEISPAEGPEKVSMSKDGKYIVFNTADRLIFMNKEREELWTRNITSARSISLAPDGDYVALVQVDSLSGSSISYYRTALPVPAKNLAPVQTPPPVANESASPEEGDRSLEHTPGPEGQAQEVEKPQPELKEQQLGPEEANQSLSSAPTSPPTTPVQSRGVCGPVSILLLALPPLLCFRSLKRVKTIREMLK